MGVDDREEVCRDCGGVATIYAGRRPLCKECEKYHTPQNDVYRLRNTKKDKLRKFRNED
jgi:hypothetical protein